MSGKAVVGLGKLGVPLAVSLASGGCRVVGLDQSAEVVEALRHDRYWSTEPCLIEQLQQQRPRLNFTTDYADLVRHSDQAFVVVPTPSSPEQPAFSLEYVKDAVRSLVTELVRQERTDYDLVVVSTVMPGACDTELWPLIASLAPAPYRPHLVYSPEFIALGSVLEGMRRPDLLLIGARHDGAYRRVADTLGSFCWGNPPVCYTSWINAELAKLCLNAALGWKITLANLVASICERFPGADVDQVTGILGYDSRIGPKYLKGGMGFGGPCLGRDVRALESISPTPGDELLGQARNLNYEQVDRALKPLYEQVEKPGPVLVLGVSYRDNTPVVEDSQPWRCARELWVLGYDVLIVDRDLEGPPAGYPQLDTSWRGTKLEAPVLEDCRGVLLAKQTRQAQELQEMLPLLPEGCVVVDPWRQLDLTRFPKLHHVAFGRGPA